MAHFYLNEQLVDASIGGVVELSGAEARHAVQVSRVRPGEQLVVGNGSGLVVTGSVASAEVARLVLTVEAVTRHPAPAPRITLVQALAKGDRDELAVQAATELGVDAVIPWAAGRSVSRWEGAKVDKGRERWAVIAREAAKQSVRPYLPEVAGLHTTRQLVALASGVRMLVLEPTATERLATVALDDRDLVLVVGPEGGVTPPELEQLAAAGATAVRLGESVLRTSTAGPAAIAALSLRLGRW